LRSEKPLSDPYGLTKRMANELEATTTAITKSVRTVMVLVMGLVRATAPAARSLQRRHAAYPSE
jgi:hypothetical protein